MEVDAHVDRAPELAGRGAVEARRDPQAGDYVEDVELMLYGRQPLLAMLGRVADERHARRPRGRPERVDEQVVRHGQWHGTPDRDAGRLGGCRAHRVEGDDAVELRSVGLGELAQAKRLLGMDLATG